MASNFDDQDSSSIQSSDVGLLQSQSRGDSQGIQDIDAGQLKDKLNTQDRDRSDQGPVERQLDDTPISRKGPLATLAERFAEHPTVQRAAYHIPNSARPILGTVAEPVSRVAGAVDSSLTSEEGTRLTSTANEFLFAVAGFTLMVLTVAVTKLESTFNVTPPESVREVTDPIANSGDGFDRGVFGEDIPRNQLYFKKARALLSRYITLVSGAIGQRKNFSESQSHSHASSSTSNVGSTVTDEVSQAADRVTENANVQSSTDGPNNNSDFVGNEHGDGDGLSSEIENSSGVSSVNKEGTHDSSGYAQSALNFASRASSATADYLRSVIPDRKKDFDKDNSESYAAESRPDETTD